VALVLEASCQVGSNESTTTSNENLLARHVVLCALRRTRRMGRSGGGEKPVNEDWARDDLAGHKLPNKSPKSS
jgi:hypothetical protein